LSMTTANVVDDGRQWDFDHTPFTTKVSMLPLRTQLSLIRCLSDDIAHVEDVIDPKSRSIWLIMRFSLHRRFFYCNHFAEKLPKADLNKACNRFKSVWYSS
jgi:hypothetical protein